MLDLPRQPVSVNRVNVDRTGLVGGQFFHTDFQAASGLEELPERLLILWPDYPQLLIPPQFANVQLPVAVAENRYKSRRVYEPDEKFNPIFWRVHGMNRH